MTCSTTFIDIPRKTSRVVPMPAWTPYTGCTRLAFSMLSIIFASICMHIWGSYVAFVVSIISSLSTISTSVYHAVALSHRYGRLYHEYTILGLECLGIALWTMSTVFLATWVHASLTTNWLADAMAGNETGYLQDLPLGLMPVKVAAEHYRKYSSGKYLATIRLAGVTCGVSALQCVLFAATLITFAKSLWRDSGNGTSITSAKSSSTLTESELNASIAQSAISPTGQLEAYGVIKGVGRNSRDQTST